MKVFKKSKFEGWSLPRLLMKKKVYLAMILPIGLPVMFPIAASAELSCIAAVLLANVSGILVPNATRVIPVTLTCNPIIQPSNFANLK